MGGGGGASWLVVWLVRFEAFTPPSTFYIYPS